MSTTTTRTYRDAEMRGSCLYFGGLYIEVTLRKPLENGTITVTAVPGVDFGPAGRKEEEGLGDAVIRIEQGGNILFEKNDD